MTKVKNKWFNLLKYVIGFLLSSILIIFITFLINPFLFIKDLESKIAYLVESESGMNLNYQNFSGNFFTGFKLEYPILSQNSKKIGKVESLNVYPGILTSIFSKQLNLKQLVLKNGNINFDNLSKNKNNLSQNEIYIKLLELQDIKIVYNKNNSLKIFHIGQIYKINNPDPYFLNL